MMQHLMCLWKTKSKTILWLIIWCPVVLLLEHVKWKTSTFSPQSNMQGECTDVFTHEMQTSDPVNTQQNLQNHHITAVVI